MCKECDIIRIDDKTKAAIEAVLSRDQRVELIPTKSGVLVYALHRKQMNKESSP